MSCLTDEQKVRILDGGLVRSVAEDVAERIFRKYPAIWIGAATPLQLTGIVRRMLGAGVWEVVERKVRVMPSEDVTIDFPTCWHDHPMVQKAIMAEVLEVVKNWPLMDLAPEELAELGLADAKRMVVLLDKVTEQLIASGPLDESSTAVLELAVGRLNAALYKASHVQERVDAAEANAAAKFARSAEPPDLEMGATI